MGLPIATLTSVGIGICSCHSPSPIPQSGIIAQGSANVLAGGLGVGKIGDIMLGGCGHTGIIVDGSPTVMTNGLMSAKMTSTFVGCFVGQVVTGVSNVLVA